MISPGFWRADKEPLRLERDLDRWRQNVNDMVASGEPWQLVVSFNEWGEGMAIEAGTEWGTPYLDVLADGLAPHSVSCEESLPPGSPRRHGVVELDRLPWDGLARWLTARRVVYCSTTRAVVSCRQREEQLCPSS